MKDLLFLAHRIPYPPNKGDKIRSFHLLTHLAQNYRVHLGAFVDDAEDWQHEAALRALCADVCLLGVNPGLGKLLSLSGLVTGEALSMPYYRNRRMRAWVEQVLAKEVDHVIVFSSPVAQYVTGKRFQHLQRIIDFVDVDSEKWRHYGAQHPWPMSWLYRREARRLLQFERAVAAEFDASVFVTADEAEVFKRLAPEAAARVTHMDNGVDTAYFDPSLDLQNPYPQGARVLAFTGAMDYWANGDAVTWFADAVLPRIRAEVPEAVFYIVGARPTVAVEMLGKRLGIEVTGAVEDTRPYLKFAAAAVAPLRVARGLQNKVLEAMAMALPVLATPAAMEGIRERHRFAELVSDDPKALATKAVGLLSRPGSNPIGEQGRELVKTQYEWDAHLKRFEALLEKSHNRGPRAAGTREPTADAVCLHR